MKFFLSVIFFLVSLVSCTSVESLKKPSADQYIVLEKNYTRVQIRGLLKYKWVEGLRAGTYILIGEDKDGFYFIGKEKDSVIVLSQERADKYLENGFITPFAERNVPQLTSAGGEGGIWLPKPGVKKEPKLFYKLHNTNDGSFGGITGMALVNMSENALAYVPYDEEKEFIKSIKVINGKP
jgi:hypothetical protein